MCQKYSAHHNTLSLIIACLCKSLKRIKELKGRETKNETKRIPYNFRGKDQKLGCMKLLLF